MKKISFLLISFLLIATLLFGTEKTFIREYTYKASDYDSKVTARANSLEQVKRLLLEEVSVFIKTETDWTNTEELIKGKYEVNDFFEKKITSITAGITETIILDENWTGIDYWIKAEITLDPNDINNKIVTIIQNKEKLKELEDVKKRADDALKEIERLKKELAEAKSFEKQLELTTEYIAEVDVLSATDWYQRGKNAYMNGELENAKEYFRKAIEIDPVYSDSYNGIGLLYYQNENYDKAIEYYKKAVEINPEHEKAYGNMGLAFHIMGNFDKAIECYQKAIEINPDLAIAYSNIGAVYHDKLSYDKCIECYQKAIKIDPDCANAYYNLGIACHEKGGDISAADSFYQAGLLYLKQNNSKRFLITIDAMKKVIPDSPLIQKLMDKLYEK